MLSEAHKTILRELAIYVTFLAGSVSSLAAPTFCELLIGGMLSGEGFLTQALLKKAGVKSWGHIWSAPRCKVKFSIMTKE